MSTHPVPNHGDCFCFESEAKRDEEKALLTGVLPSVPLSPLSPCFIPTLSSEPIFLVVFLLWERVLLCYGLLIFLLRAW